MCVANWQRQEARTECWLAVLQPYALQLQLAVGGLLQRQDYYVWITFHIRLNTT